MPKKTYEQYQPDTSIPVHFELGEIPTRLFAETVRHHFFNELSSTLIKKLQIEVPNQRPFTREEVVSILREVPLCVYDGQTTIDEVFEGRHDVLNYFVIQGLLAIINEQFQHRPKLKQAHAETLQAIASELQIKDLNPQDLNDLLELDAANTAGVNFSNDSVLQIQRILHTHLDFLAALTDKAKPLDEIMNEWLNDLAFRATHNRYLMYALVSGDQATVSQLVSNIKGALVVGAQTELPPEYTDQALAEAHQSPDNFLGALSLALHTDSHQAVIEAASALEGTPVSPRLTRELDNTFAKGITGG